MQFLLHLHSQMFINRHFLYQSIRELKRECLVVEMRFCLVDDFAEAHVYRSVLKQLNELHSEIGLKFSYE